MFCKNTMGIPLALQSSIKWVPLRADSENRIPLLAKTPISYPNNLANPVTNEVP